MRFIRKYNKLLKEDEEFKIYMDPLEYAILLNYVSDEKLLFYIYQDELHFLLNSFLDPLELSNSSKVLYPLKSNIQQQIIERCYLLQEYIKKYIKYLPISTTVIEYIRSNRYNNQNPECLSKFISLLYNEFINNYRSHIGSRSSTIHLEPITIEIYKKDDFLKPIFLMYEYLKKDMDYYLTSFILHGSLATLDYVKGWSDVDTYIVVKDQIVIDNRQLLKLRKLIFNLFKYFTMVNPFQHHGVFAVTEADLSLYPQTYLPFETLKYSRSIIGETTLLFKEREEELESLLYFWKTIQAIRRYSIFKPHNYYSAFLFLNYLNILPTYYLQAKGIHVYKKYSFNIVEKEGLEGYECIKVASLLRSKYTRKSIFNINLQKIINGVVPNPLYNLETNYIMNNKLSLNNNLLDNIINNSVILADSMLKNVLSNK